MGWEVGKGLVRVFSWRGGQHRGWEGKRGSGGKGRATGWDEQNAYLRFWTSERREQEGEREDEGAGEHDYPALRPCT